MLVAFPPGGADDATARIIQDAMQKALGQPIVIENVGGAGGDCRRQGRPRADPDGYTILLHQDALAAGMTLIRIARSMRRRISSPSASSIPPRTRWQDGRRCRRTISTNCYAG